MLPGLAVFAVFIAYPIVANIISSLLGPNGGVALANYRQAGGDAVFWTALRNSAVWVVLCVVFEVAIGFVLALAIEMYIPRGRVVFRTLLFLPMVITPSVIALVFSTIYAPDYGLLFGLFDSVRARRAFPGHPRRSRDCHLRGDRGQCLAVVRVLRADVLRRPGADRPRTAGGGGDRRGGRAGARALRDLAPAASPTTTSLVVLGTIQALQQFPLIFLMTEGGPADSTQTLATYIFQTGFVLNETHYASAVAVVLFALVAGTHRVAVPDRPRGAGGAWPRSSASARVLVAYLVLLIAAAAISLVPTDLHDRHLAARLHRQFLPDADRAAA